jgi:transposase InsO family protein
VSKARLVITAVVVEGRSPGEVATAYGVSRSWVYELVARYRAEGDTALEPRSQRPKTSPRKLPQATVELIVELRRDLEGQGLDAGPDTIVWHLEHHHGLTVSTSSVLRYLRRAGLITPQPAKRPKASYIRFQAELPNECWQADVTHYPLADGTDAEILCFVDDHSRYALSVTAHQPVTGTVVVAAFRSAVDHHGPPASTLTDNGMVSTTRLSGGRGGRNGFETELRRLGVTQKNSRPNHPTTCGKVERFQQTLKRWLRARPNQPATLAQLQPLLDDFVEHYNQRRPHRSLPRQATPAAAYHTRPKATPPGRDNDEPPRDR